MRETKRFNRIEVENFIKEFDAIDIPANFKEFISNNLKNYKYRYIEFDVLWNSICEQQTTDNVQ